MKRFLSFLALCAFLWPLLQSAQGADASVNLFYDNLSGGNWYEVADYGYVWQPDVATNENWRPYTDGYWAYTDQGWTWVSYEDFGWATYHYGRWARLADYGWVWVPGTEWAPAWVSWRTGGDYVGWAPLPPAGGGEVVYESRPITGHVDVEFGIGPAYYNFVDLRYIGEPVLRDRIVDYNQNVTIVNNTVNVTNITYNNSTVYSYGPDYAAVSRYSIRPIQRLKLQRQTMDPAQAIRNGSVTKVQGNTLVVAAPQKLQKVAGAQIAPKQVKARIEQPKVEKGWANTDPGEKAKLEQKFKAENVKNVPKPDIQPRGGNAAMAPVNANQNAVATSPAERPGKGNRKGERAATSAPAAAVASPNAIEQPGRSGKNKTRVERGQQIPEASAPPAAENRPANAETGNARRNKANTRDENIRPKNEVNNATGNERNGVKAKPQKPTAAPARENDQGVNRNQEQREQAMKRQAQQREGQQRTNQAQQREMQQGRAQQHQAQQREASPQHQTPQREAPPRAQERPQQKPPAANPAVSGAAGEKRQPREGAQGTPQGQPQKNGQGEPRKGKGKKNEGEATPPPQ